MLDRFLYYADDYVGLGYEVEYLGLWAILQVDIAFLKGYFFMEMGGGAI